MTHPPAQLPARRSGILLLALWCAGPAALLLLTGGWVAAARAATGPTDAEATAITAALGAGRACVTIRVSDVRPDTGRSRRRRQWATAEGLLAPGCPPLADLSVLHRARGTWRVERAGSAALLEPRALDRIPFAVQHDLDLHRFVEEAAVAAGAGIDRRCLRIAVSYADPESGWARADPTRATGCPPLDPQLVLRDRYATRRGYRIVFAGRLTRPECPATSGRMPPVVAMDLKLCRHRLRHVYFPMPVRNGEKRPTVRPRAISLGFRRLDRIRWRRWGGRAATGRGSYILGRRTVPVRVRLSGRRECRGVIRVYVSLQVIAVRARDRGTLGVFERARSYTSCDDVFGDE